MKRKLLLLIFTITFLFTGMMEIKADITGQDPGSTSGGSITNGSYNAFAGFRVNVYKEDGTKITGIDVTTVYRSDGSDCRFNQYVRCNDSYLYHSKTYSKIDYLLKSYKIEFKQGTGSSEVNYCNVVGNTCIGDYLLNEKDLSTYFTETSSGVKVATDNLKKILSFAGYKCLELDKNPSARNECGENHYLSIEPIFDLVYANDGKDYYGTAFEMSKVFNLSLSGMNRAAYNSLNAFRTGFKYTFGGKNIERDIEDVGDKTNPKYDILNTVSSGNAITIYKISDLSPKLIVKKETNPAGGNVSGVTFRLYKNGSVSSGDQTTCKGEALESKTIKEGKSEVEFLFLQSGETYCVEETKVNSGYTKANAQTITIKAGENKLTFTNKKINGHKVTITKKVVDDGDNELDAEKGEITFKVKGIDSSNSSVEGSCVIPSGGESCEIDNLTKGKYSITEVIPDKYNYSYSHCNGCNDKTTFTMGNKDRAITIYNKYNLKELYLIKEDENGNKLNGVSFALCYSDGFSSCQFGSTVNGKITFTIPDYGTNKDYRLYEQLPDKFYGAICSNGCKTEEANDFYGSNYDLYFDVVLNSKKTYVTIVNTGDCAKEFDEEKARHGSVSMAYRLNMYFNRYPEKNGLLNLGNTTGSSACKKVNCNEIQTTNCLSGSVISNDFNINNLSCYNDYVLSMDQKVGLCQTTLAVSNVLGQTSFFAKKKGMTFIEYSDVVMSGLLTKRCYIYGGYAGVISNPQILRHTKEADDIVSASLKYDGEEQLESGTTEWNYVGKTGGLEIYTAKKEYNFKEICLDESNHGALLANGSANDANCIGKGMISKFDSASSGTLSFSFKFDLSEIQDTPSKGVSYTPSPNSCTYSIGGGDTPPPPLNLEFRMIDVSHPFPGKDGNGRKTGSNWCGKDKDGNDTCNGDDTNSAVSENISNRSHSYSLNAKYVIDLSPSDIQKIRQYNKTTSYDDAHYKYYTSTGRSYDNYEECESNNGGNACEIRSLFLLNLRNSELKTYDNTKQWTLDNGLVVN